MTNNTWDPKDDIFKQFAMTPDEQLLVWDDWIKIRENDVMKLAYRTLRPPVDLAMNQLEKCRPHVERKVTLEEAQQALKACERKGSEWTQKLFLKQRCPCENAYKVQSTRVDRGKSRIMQHVLCPDYIQRNEKGLLGEPERNLCLKLDKAYDEYRQHREEIFQEKILKIDPYRPDMRELIVIGKQPMTPPKPPPVPVISITTENDSSQDDTLTQVYALRINNTVTIKKKPDCDLSNLKQMQSEPCHESCNSWTYYFNVSERRIGRCKLLLENLGTVALRYCWKKIKKVIPYIPEEIYEQHFFFNKNEDVISPGQKKTIYITFVSSKAGIYSESWELALVNVSLFDDIADKFSIHLIADSVENVKKRTRKIERLESRIDKKVMRQFIFTLLNDLIMEITNVKHEIYPYQKWFDEGEIFVSRNMQHFFHQTEVQTLKETFKQMTSKNWDLSLVTWRNFMIEKEFDERMRCYDQLKKSHVVLLAPWYEGDDVLITKYRNVKLLLWKLADIFYDEFQRVSNWNGVANNVNNDPKAVNPRMKQGPLTDHIVLNIFYMKMYDHISNTIETIAGTLSSLDMNRWIEFDFCQT